MKHIDVSSDTLLAHTVRKQRRRTRNCGKGNSRKFNYEFVSLFSCSNYGSQTDTPFPKHDSQIPNISLED